MIRHPGASAVVPVSHRSSGRRPTDSVDPAISLRGRRYLYEVPAGRLDANESPDHCARRELREETGCEAERVEHMFTMYTTPGFTNERIHVFMAVGLTRGEVAREANEFIEVGRCRCRGR